MKQTFTARVWKEDEWSIAQCAQVDVASHGRTEEEALANLREALELYFEPPTATVLPPLRAGGCARSHLSVASVVLGGGRGSCARGGRRP